MSLTRKKLGALGEKLAVEYLKKLSYKILETNFRCPEGEMDIVAQKEGQLAFVEVRTKRSSGFGAPEESLTHAKKKRLIEVANVYLQSHEDLPTSWHIDVVAVELGASGKVLRVELIENAVS